MQPNRQTDKRKVGVSLHSHLVTFIALLIVAVVLNACARPSQNGKVQQPPTTPSPSPTPSPTSSPGTELLPGDTIIVVKDGSVEIEVNTTLCTDASTANDTVYKCNGVALDAATIRNEKAHPPAPCPKVNKLSKVTIDGGGSKDIVIQGHVFHTEIKFKKADYPACGTGPGKYCGTNKVGKVKVDSNYSKDCDPAEKCEIWVHKK